METENKIKVYIAGPMRNVHDFNRKAFNRAERSLIRNGIYSTVNPVTLDKDAGLTDDELETKEGLRIVMRRDLELLLTCDQIYMLWGWEKSEGAKIEHALAVMVGMQVKYQ